MNQHIFWYEGGVLYRATYYDFLERIVVKRVNVFGNEITSQRVVYTKLGISPIDWKSFKLGIIKWKKHAQDVEKK